MMKFFASLIASLGIVGMFAFAALPASAQIDPFNDVCQGVTDATVCEERNSTNSDTVRDNSIFGPRGIFTRAVNIVSLLVGIASVVVILIAGLRYIVSGGDSAKVTTARSAVFYALIGLGVTAFSQALIIFVLNRL